MGRLRRRNGANSGIFQKGPERSLSNAERPRRKLSARSAMLSGRAGSGKKIIYFRTSISVWLPLLCISLAKDNPPLPAVSLVRGRRYSRGSPQMLDASLPADKEPLPDCRISDPKLLGAKCRILRSLPTRTPVDYKDRAPKAHTRIYPTSPMRTLIDYKRRSSIIRHTPGVKASETKLKAENLSHSFDLGQVVAMEDLLT
ncbi:hypothetical protein AgCh_035451 [Apium graveolens]